MNSPIDPVEARRKVIAGSRRIVIKIGSRLLSGMKNVSKRGRIHQLIEQIASIRKQGIDVILVTSGAISSGMEIAGIRKRPSDVPRLQALAATGQSRLMSLYEYACRRHGFHCGQILLCYDDLKDRKRHLNLCNCIHSLLSQQILPIVNENDAVSVDELSFGDNDKLAALLAVVARADLTILLTSVDGLLWLKSDGFGDRVPLVDKITVEIQQLAKGTDGNPHSQGGMVTKLAAAEICLASGENLWIANGSDFGVLRDVFAAKDVGTLFYACGSRMSSSKRWLAFFTDPNGTIQVDRGAGEVLKKSGKSLLPSGVVQVRGQFEEGDTVNLADEAGAIFGMGITNYRTEDIEKIRGLQTSAIADRLGVRGYDEIIHRDNMVIF